jgi:hypothetical protein
MVANISEYLDGPIGAIIRGFLKLALAPVIVALVSAIPPGGSITVAGTTIDTGTLLAVIKVFVPLLLVASGLRDFGVKL